MRSFSKIMKPEAMSLYTWKHKTPVVLLIFNRPDTTAQVFESIRQAQPPKLLVVADGPRPDRPGEAEKCTAARAIIKQVDWPCEVLTNYAETNLGCGRRVSSGLDWVFDTVEEATILEDDCLPHPTFFRFCEELLEKYRNDERVMHISGSNFQFGRKRGEASYYFSRYPHGTGWASWRRAWQFFDVDLKLWESADNRKIFLRDFNAPAERKFWELILNLIKCGKLNTVWDYQWAFACITQHALGITPNVNLISNIGFGMDATHTVRADDVVANLPISIMEFPLVHPHVFMRDAEADEHTSEFFFRIPSMSKRVSARVSRIIHNVLHLTVAHAE